MVDWDGLENRCASDGTVGSNPTLSSAGPFEGSTIEFENILYYK